MFISKNISSFKIAEEQNIQFYMRNYVFKHAKLLYVVMIGQGTFILTMIIMAVCIILFGILYKLLGSDSWVVNKIKQKIIWSSVFRGQIQFYFPVALVVFHHFDKGLKTDSDSMVTIIKFLILICLPVFSFVHLKKNYLNLENGEFYTKFNTLYQNLYPLKHTVYKMNTIFCIKRLIYASSAIFLGEYCVP